MAVGGECGCGSVVRVDFHCPIQQIERLLCRVGIGREYVRKSSHRKAVSVEVLRSFTLRALDLEAPDLRQDCAHYTYSDSILQCEQIANLAVVSVSPHMKVCGGVE